MAPAPRLLSPALTLASWLGLSVCLSLSVTPSLAAAQTAADRAEVDRILEQIRSEDRVESTSAAISLRHLVGRQSSLRLFDQTHLRWWQQSLLPAMPTLVDHLADERGLEWVDGMGNTEQITTPRQEARQALVALGRASVEPLIAALDRPGLSRKADEVLRQILRGGPAGAHRASWESYWSARRDEALPGEEGRIFQVLLGTLLLGGLVTLLMWWQRQRQHKLEVSRPRLAVPVAAPPPATVEPPAQNLPR